MRLRLVRHGQPAWAVEGRSIDDPWLTPVGLEQARRVARRLADDAADHLLVSPLRRARETAAPLESLTGRAATERHWLAEITNPRWEGEPVEHVERVFAAQRQRPVEELWDGLEGGESFHAFHDRVTTGLFAELGALGVTARTDQPRLWDLADPDLDVVAVAHAGTNAVVVGALLGIPPVPWEWERFVSLHASVTVLESVPIGGGHAFTLHRLSDVSHLPEGIQTV